MDSKLFEALFVAWSRRVAVEKLERQRDEMVNAMFSNPNYDSKEGQAARRERMEMWDQHLEEATELIYGERRPVADTDFENNAFYAPAMRAKKRLDGMQIPDDISAAVRRETGELPRGLDLDQT